MNTEKILEREIEETKKRIELRNKLKKKLKKEKNDDTRRKKTNID